MQTLFHDQNKRLQHQLLQLPAHLYDQYQRTYTPRGDHAVPYIRSKLIQASREGSPGHTTVARNAPRSTPRAEHHRPHSVSGTAAHGQDTDVSQRAGAATDTPSRSAAPEFPLAKAGSAMPHTGASPPGPSVSGAPSGVRAVLPPGSPADSLITDTIGAPSELAAQPGLPEPAQARSQSSSRAQAKPGIVVTSVPDVELVADLPEWLLDLNKNSSISNDGQLLPDDLDDVPAYSADPRLAEYWVSGIDGSYPRIAPDRLTRYYSIGKTRTFSGDIMQPGNAAEAFQRCSYDREIIMMCSDVGDIWFEFVFGQVMMMQERGYAHIVIFMDSKSHCNQFQKCGTSTSHIASR
jgi:hypothetical protein